MVVYPWESTINAINDAGIPQVGVMGAKLQYGDICKIHMRIRTLKVAFNSVRKRRTK